MDNRRSLTVIFENQNNHNYLFSIFGVHGAGKTTASKCVNAKFDLKSPTSNNKRRMITSEGLLENLNIYGMQNKEISDKPHTQWSTDRYGPLDVAVYSHSLKATNQISNTEFNSVNLACLSAARNWAIKPGLLVGLTCDFNILSDRLVNREKANNRNFKYSSEQLKVTKKIFDSISVRSEDLPRTLLPILEEIGKIEFHYIDTTTKNVEQTCNTLIRIIRNRVISLC